MSGKRNISYVKPQDPSFLTKLKSQIGYKEGPTVDVKRQKLDCGKTDQDSSDGQSDHEEEKPQVVVLRSGDLTAEEVTQEEARIAREAAAVRADLSKPIIFQSKQAKDIKEARKILKKSAKKSEQLHKKFDEIAEAGVTMPEESSLLISHATNTSELMSSAVTTTANNGPQQMLNDQENGNAKVVNITSTTDAETDCMEVDAISSKGDDTQIASFPADNGISDGEDSRISANAEVKCIPVLPSSDGKNQVDESIKPASAVDDSEDSSNASDDAFPDLSPSQTVAAENQNNVVSDLKSNSGSTKHIDSMSKAGCERSDLPPNGNSKKSVSYEGTNSDGTDDVRMDKANEPALCSKKGNGSEKKENGSAESTLKVRHDTGIVDLDDESDEEMPSPKQQTQERDPLSATCADSVQATLTAIDATGKKAQSVCSDSDGAVVIASDSDNELSIISPKKTGSQQKPVTEVIDDDDDDCVVIEDDSPAPPATDLIKRKSVTMNSPNNLDDPQPPSKRQRSTPQTGVNQITIKDARSLLPQEAAAAAAAKKMVDGSVYPVNITPAPSVVPGPPKLVPVATPTMQMGSFPGLGSNTNLLPGLTDDMFVLEAPSFIVPYIYEKPPTDQLKDIVKGIETKYRLTKEDLAEADKSDEFDMITEQNKEDKGDKGGKKKKRRRGGDDADESWSEESEEDEDDDDDDDSESGMRTKVLIKEASDDLTALKGAIKPAAALAQSPSTAAAAAAKPGQENYFESPLGKFFMDIGVGLVQEFVQSDLIRLQKRKMRKSLGKNITEFERAISALSGNLEASKKKNTAFKFTMKRCEFCNFKSESALAMANHYETPHMNGPLYKCNFCTFEIRNATEIVYHMEAMHNIKARLIKPLPYHQCPNCGFEDNGKAKLARHQPVCAKKFRPELNLAPPNDWEAPAKIPRIKPRHGLVGTATAYQAMAAQAAAQKAALASIQQQQQQAAQARSLQAAALAAQNAANKIRGRPPTITKPGLNSNVMLRGPNQVRNPMATNVVLPNNYQVAGGQLIQAANTIAKKALSGQPSISITPLPRQNATPQITSPSTSKMPPTGMKPGQNPSGNKAQFVICEICDGYIKDLEQLRNHMQWMHKVKIHPKMIYNRPPLNCQKCQFRFFTDQGLERHLLGSHGLVTSSMQEAANKGKDAGRCPVCGRMYQWKLLNHVSRDHHMTLKPAHLSYKCTVCTATFGMYKQFETHVYTAHSTVAKKAMDGKKNNTPPGVGIASSTSSSLQRGNLVPSNDSLLKPLKINDEITIIPQPATKPRLTNIESHVID